MMPSSLFFLLFIFLPLILLVILSFLVRPRPAKVPIRGRHVLVSGGSSGIGLAIASQAASSGARVTILARNPDRLEEARRSILKTNGAAEINPTSVDVRDFTAVRRAVESCSPVDVLVCSHGVFVPEELATQDIEKVKEMLEINLMGAFNLVKAVLPGMKEKKDGTAKSIALVSSQAGQVGVHGYTAYSASKFGLRGLAEALQQEVIADNIHVSLVFPPDTETPGFAEEQKNRPELSKAIAESSSAMQANDVAKKTLEGIKSGTFMVSCNFDGYMLAIATAGMSPQRSYLMAFVEVAAIGFMRLVALIYVWKWYETIQKWHSKQKK